MYVQEYVCMCMSLRAWVRACVLTCTVLLLRAGGGFHIAAALCEYLLYKTLMLLMFIIANIIIQKPNNFVIKHCCLQSI